MKRAKNRLDMTVHTPTELQGKSLGNIMDAQNTKDRGDGTSSKVMMTFQIEESLRNELKDYCRDNGMKIGGAVNQAIRSWLETR